MLTNAELGGIIGAGIFVLLFLLLLLLLIILLVRRQRRKDEKKFKTTAHDNPTYMAHAQLKQQVLLFIPV